MNHRILFPLLALLILVGGSSCSTSRLSKTSFAKNRAEIIAQIPAETDETPLASSTKLDPQPAAESPEPAIAEAKKVEPEVEAPVVEAPVVETVTAVSAATPAPAVIVTGPSAEEKSAAIEAEKAELAKISETPTKNETQEQPKADGFAPDPYFTLFTKTESDSAGE